MNGCRSISGDPDLRLAHLKLLKFSFSKGGDYPIALRPQPPPLPIF